MATPDKMDSSMASSELDAGGGDQSQQPPEETPQHEGGAASESFYIPKDMLGGKSYKQGDSITLEVMGEDQDGDLEVCLPNEAGADWRSELKSQLSDAGGQNG
jgi:hypothetical protein